MVVVVVVVEEEEEEQQQHGSDDEMENKSLMSTICHCYHLPIVNERVDSQKGSEEVHHAMTYEEQECGGQPRQHGHTMNQ